VNDYFANKRNSTKRVDIKHIAIAVSFLFHSFIHWFFPYIFGETPLKIMKLGTGDGSKNYIINLVSYTVITLVPISLIALVVKHKVKWVNGAVIGTLISIALNVLVVSLAYYIMIRNLHYERNI
jgi:hypothetical protein